MNKQTEHPIDESFVIIDGIDENLEPMVHLETEKASPSEVTESFIIDIPPSPKPQPINKKIGALIILLGISGVTIFSWILNGKQSPTNKIIESIGASISLAGMFFLLKNRSVRAVLSETDDRPHHH